jgi:ABC-2 type transport system permease protein
MREESRMALEILVRTIKDKMLSALILAVILFLYIFWLASFFPQLGSLGTSFQQFAQNPAFKAFVGDQVLSLTTYPGFISMEVFSYMGLVVGAFIAFLTASFIAGEIEQKTSDLLLSLPVSRESIVVQRFIALIPAILLIMAAMLGAIYGGAVYIGQPVQAQWFLIAIAFMGAFLLAVAGGSLLVSALMSDGRRAALVSIGILFAMYILENVGSMVTGLDWARHLSLFHYTQLINIAVAHQVDWVSLAVLLVFAIVCLALAAIVFKRRDINIS